MKSLFFIAIIPPEKICNEITAFKRDMALRFNSAKALKTLPHITLFPPISLEEDATRLFLEKFEALALKTHKISVKLQDFGCFPNKKNPVIFVNPLKNNGLKTLQKKVFEAMSPEGFHYTFHPHVTVAFRDLSFENFEKAWQEYSQKEYAAEFVVDKIYLLKHNGSLWEIFAEKLISNT